MRDYPILPTQSGYLAGPARFRTLLDQLTLIRSALLEWIQRSIIFFVVPSNPSWDPNGLTPPFQALFYLDIYEAAALPRDNVRYLRDRTRTQYL